MASAMVEAAQGKLVEIDPIAAEATEGDLAHFVSDLVEDVLDLASIYRSVSQT